MNQDPYLRGLARVRHAVVLKALGWNIRQAARAVKARILTKLEQLSAGMKGKIHRVSVIHLSARMTGYSTPYKTAPTLCLTA